MARRNQQNDTQTLERDDTEVENDMVEETTSTDTAAPAATTETKTDAAPADLSAFQAAAETAVSQADPSDGEVPEEAMGPVNEAYRSLDGIKAKNKAKDHLEDQMKLAIVGGNIHLAKSYMRVKDNLLASTPKAEKAPSDPTEAFVQQNVALRFALEIQQANDENIASDWGQRVTTMEDELRSQIPTWSAWLSGDQSGDAPEVSGVVKAAHKLAAGKATRASGGASTRVPGAPRRDIAKHIEQVFADKAVGTFLSVNDVAKAASDEYGTDRPSAGAVSARVFPQPGPDGAPKEPKPFGDGLERDVPSDGSARGIRKVA